jgi:hypothetical protein
VCIFIKKCNDVRSFIPKQDIHFLCFVLRQGLSMKPSLVLLSEPPDVGITGMHHNAWLVEHTLHDFVLFIYNGRKENIK